MRGCDGMDRVISRRCQIMHPRAPALSLGPFTHRMQLATLSQQCGVTVQQMNNATHYRDTLVNTSRRMREVLVRLSPGGDLQLPLGDFFNYRTIPVAYFDDLHGYYFNQVPCRCPELCPEPCMPAICTRWECATAAVVVSLKLGYSPFGSQAHELEPLLVWALSGGAWHPPLENNLDVKGDKDCIMRS